MLKELRVKNFAIVEDGILDFGSGMIAFTGETGAGKSLLLDAISLLLGAKARSDLIRAGARSAEIEGCFDLSQEPERWKVAEGLGFFPEEDNPGFLLVRREISQQEAGRNRIWIQGRSATRAQLQEVLGDWVEVSGQHEFLRLGREDYLLQLVDQFGGLRSQRASFENLFTQWKQLSADLKALKERDADRSRRLEYLRFQLDDFDKANVGPDTPEREARLLADRTRLSSIEKIRLGMQMALHRLEGEDGESSGAVGHFQALARDLRAYETMGADLARCVQLADQGSELSHELLNAVQKVLRTCDADPQALEEAEAELSALNRLKRKFATDTEGLCRLRTEFLAEIEDLGSSSKTLEDRSKLLDSLSLEMRETGLKLHAARVKAASDLGTRWSKELRKLGIPNAVLEVGLSVDIESPKTSGFTAIQVLFSANAGEPAKPLAKIASGGELSRVMLGVKSLVAGKGEVGVYLFDEVDAGLGGETALVVGAKLRQLAKDNQVLVVTHLAQTAAHAHHQFRIYKESERGKTRTRIRRLDGSDRETELARMLGSAESSSARRLARELLEVDL